MSRSAISAVEALIQSKIAAPHATNASADRRAAIRGATLAAADLISAFITLFVVQALLQDHVRWFAPALLLVESVGLVALLAASGLYSRLGVSDFERLRIRALAISAFSAAEAGLHATSLLSAVVLLFATVIALLIFSYYAELAASVWLARRKLWLARALIIGDDARAETLIRELNGRPALGIRPVAVFAPVDPSGASVLGIVPLPVISGSMQAPEPVDVAIAVGRANLTAFERVSVQSYSVSKVVLLSDGANGESLWLSKRSLGSVTGQEVGRAYGSNALRVVKRSADVILGSLLAVPAALLIALAAAAVKAVDPGPIFYTHRRIGKDGRPIDVLKVRSMYCDSDERLKNHFIAHPEARSEWERFFKLKNDPRVLPVVGALIRTSSVDELPQLFNVLKGEMTLVGPRPFPEYHLAKFDDDFRALRLSVAPGLTGLWQVSTRSEGDLEAQKADDTFYIRNRSLWLDLYILLQTIPAVLTGNGAR